MPNYDFRALSPYDFQGLVRDLLQQELGLTLETFAVGPDGGVDLRQVSAAGEIVIQCKHYVKSGYQKLFQNLRHEIPKVSKLKPIRYIVATSVSLTPGNKSDIKQLFAPYLLSESDIYGGDDLNNLLGKFPEIEKQTFKLWLTSAAVLQKLLHNDIYVRTQGLLDSLARRARVYVQNSSFQHAWRILQDKKVCIITGIPGVGKTMLAEMLLVRLVDLGYEPILISSDVGEGDKVFNPESKQAFYYDDFLGQASLADKQLNKNEDGRLAEFIKRVISSPNKRFILTTREYILTDARIRYEKLDNLKATVDRCIIKMNDYTEFDRAKILYNHLYFSDLRVATKFSVARNKAYLKIIRHDNYNPRLIEKVVELSQKSQDTPDGFLSFMMSTLEEPSSLWRHAYEHLTDSAKLILIALVSLSSEVEIGDLELAFGSLYRTLKGAEPPLNEFINALQILEDTFSRTDKYSRLLVVSFHNPSIRDFMLGLLDKRDDHVDLLIRGAHFFDQLVALWRYSNERVEPKDTKLRHPGLSSSVKKRLPALLARGQHTFHAPATTLRTSRTRDGKTHKERDAVSPEARLLVVHAIEQETASPPPKWVEEERISVTKAWSRKQGSKHHAVRLLEAGILPGDARTIASKWFLETLQDRFDFEVFIELRESMPDLFSEADLEHVRDRFEQFLPDEITWMLERAELPSDVETAYDDAKHLARELGVEWEYSDEEIQERIEKLASKYPDEDDYDEDLAREHRWEMENEAREMEAMFATLADDGD